MPRQQTNTPEVFWTRVKKTRKCWLWTKHTDKDGYGNFWVKDKPIRTHIYVMLYTLKVKIPKGSFVCHTCDNPTCVRPSHLFIGTPKQNSEDRDAKGRGIRGEKCHLAKLTAKAVKYIRSLHKPNHRKIAEQYGVTRSVISNMLRGLTWKHVK